MSTLYFQNTNARSFGTYPLMGDELIAAVEAAIAVGYRSFDTAQMYGNEADVGRALAGCGVERDALCITTKVEPDNFSEEKFIPSVRASLEALQIEYADALLLHWPASGGDNRAMLAQLQLAHSLGLAKHIGVSNFTAAQMREAKQLVSIPLVCNQVEFHPLLDQSSLLAAAVETGIPLTAYCSMARGAVFKHSLFQQIGDSIGKTAGQVVLHWALQKGVAINTMSTKPQNIAENFDIADFTLSNVAMAQIDELAKTGLRIVNSDKAPWAPDWD
jgi:2,5-diketo-D-gluconate reductase B